SLPAHICAMIPLNSAVRLVVFADSDIAEFRNAVLQAVLLVFARAERPLDEKVRAFRESLSVFGKLPECDYAVPLGAVLPLALIVLPGFLGGYRERRDRRAVLRIVQFGVLAGETDDGELVHIHSFDLLRIDLSPRCPGALQSKRPRSQASGVLCWGTGRAACGFEARLGVPRKQNTAQRRARGFKRSCAQDNGGDREVGRRSTD